MKTIRKRVAASGNALISNEREIDDAHLKVVHNSTELDVKLDKLLEMVNYKNGFSMFYFFQKSFWNFWF